MKKYSLAISLILLSTSFSIYGAAEQEPIPEFRPAAYQAPKGAAASELTLLKQKLTELKQVLTDALSKLNQSQADWQIEIFQKYIKDRIKEAQIIFDVLKFIPEVKADDIKDAQLFLNVAKYSYKKRDYKAALAALISFTRGLLKVNAAALTLEQEKELEEAEMKAIKRKRTEKLPGRARRSGTNKLLVPESKASESGDEHDEGPFEA